MGDDTSRPTPRDQRGRPHENGGLSLTLIVDEALALIDERGIAEASMRNLGLRLGVGAMALYRYVRGRDDLFDAVVDRIVEELDDNPDVPKGASDNGWRCYLDGLARGVRHYALAHPHAFPLVATRPPDAPWINPPLRSLRWIEAVLTELHDAGFTDDEVLFTYRTFNSFLLGFLLLETSARVLDDPKPGDGSFQSGSPPDSRQPDAAGPVDPIPGTRRPTTRATPDRAPAAKPAAHRALTDPTGNVSRHDYPTLHRLHTGLMEDQYDREFSAGLISMLDRIELRVAGDGQSG